MAHRQRHDLLPLATLTASLPSVIDDVLTPAQDVTLASAYSQGEDRFADLGDRTPSLNVQEA